MAHGVDDQHNRGDDRILMEGEIMKPIVLVIDAVRHAQQLEGDWTRLSLGPMVHLLRRRRATDQKELARRAALSQSQISHIERGRVQPPWSTIARIFQALGCRPILLPQPTSDWPRLHAQWREADA